MFPIRDHNPSLRTPYVTYVLMAINIVVYLGTASLLTTDIALANFYGDWAMFPGQITDGRHTYSLISSMFLHGGLMHLGGNMLFLWIFGDNIEDELGHLGFLGFYLICGIAAGLAQAVADPGSMIPTVGASGAIAGVMGGYLLLYPRARIDILFILVIIFKVFPVPAWVMLCIWFGFQLFSGFATDISGGGVAYWAHAGGFLAGLALILPVWLRRGGTDFWDRNLGRPPHPEAEYEMVRSRIPRIKRK